MDKYLTIIGGGFASWVVASVFAKKGYFINIFEGKDKSFGSQQISPNGWFALSKLINSKLIQPHFEAFHNIHFKKLNSKQNVEFLSQYNLINKTSNFGSIERKNIINLFKNQTLKKKSIKVYNSQIKHIISDNENKQILDNEGRVFEAKYIIGADGINGITRRFVVGSNNNINSKKIFRAVSFQNNPYQLTKKILQVLFHNKGYFVIYPTKINKKKATNYIFVPINNNYGPPIINNKTVNYLIPKDLDWITTFSSYNSGEKTSIYKNGVFLFGDAAFTIPPHLAQAGNQILEDAAFIRNSFTKNSDFKEIINSFIKNRYLKKNIIANKSSMIGKIFSSQKLFGSLRNLGIKSNNLELFDHVLNPIWTNENHE